ncbi:MAG: hypothetical protein COB02_01910 [Candidatus Cloacimonadota bacterium]|nr:MAG: hypothetical protein COB02_01910 [Candidatus Cloacimonadota bacterium]
MKFTKKIIGNQFNSREERNQFIASEFHSYINSTLLNVGGGGHHYMKKHLDEQVQYFELDIAGSPDLKINLEKEIPIPIENNKYETVVCTDVLEHLDNFHQVFNELLRISSKYLIISLPNSVTSLMSYYKNKVYENNNEDRRKQFGKYTKYYGLPYEKPEDRHKWLFSYTEAEDFFIYHSKKKNFKIAEMFPVGYYNNSSWKRTVFRTVMSMFGSKDFQKNMFSDSFWIVIEKKEF